MTGVYRLQGGLIRRDQKVNFSFDGRAYAGHPGDTLASALVANGVRLVGRSFKYHRPRGIVSSGSDEPNALVTLGAGAETEPNTRATMVELRDGLSARSQNHRGSLGFDLLAVSDLLSPFLSAGFYYKTFMWPRTFWEKLYEPAIRGAAGLGRLSGEADPSLYDKGYLHCDVLVIGAGPAGLSAALAAGRAGARVILADEDFLAGGRLNAERHEIDGLAGHVWAANARAELEAMANVRVMPRTTVFGVFDHGIYGAVEQTSPDALSLDQDDFGLSRAKIMNLIDYNKLERDPGGTEGPRKREPVPTFPHPALDRPRQVLWRVYARQSILGAGAMERSLVFPGNDRPGVMLAGAVQAYANRWAAAAGRRVAIFANNSGASDVARDLEAAGVEVAALIDVRPDGSAREMSAARHLAGARVAKTSGRKGLRGVTLVSGEHIACDCLAVSGGWSPNLHLTCHTDGKPVWREDIQAFVPGERVPTGMQVAGAANGHFMLSDIMREADEVGRTAAANAGFTPPSPQLRQTSDGPVTVAAFWHVAEVKGRAWVDLQNDVTAKDIGLASQEGFRAVEHLKRYTTLGMATDQGKTSNVAGLAILAEMTGRTIPETGTTRYRPPYTPVSIGVFAGRERGGGFQPCRLTPGHDWARANGASFVTSGLWLRAEWFARPGEEGWRDSVDREVQQTRASVGVCDVSTLGKIDVQGRDATEFVNFVYANSFAKLPVGKVRYGVMLREDGMVMDDGTAARLSENHYLVTTTTANAGPVYRHLEFVRQCLKPDRDVHLVPETDGWAQFSVAGPNARNLLKKLVDAPFDMSNEAFPFMACANLTVCGGTTARLFRISFSGELAYEIAVPASYGQALAEVLMQAGKEFDVVAYGVEALDVMRIEKGHASGNELIGQTTLENLGLGKMAGKNKDYIGRTLAGRSVVDGLDGMRMVGLVPVDHTDTLFAGAHFMAEGAKPELANDQGWMSSVCYSPALGHSIGLGFVRDGEARLGEHLRSVDLVRGTDILVKIVSPHFLDPEGDRLHG